MSAQVETLEFRRLLANVGQLDPTFADNGIALTGFAGNNPYGGAVAVTTAGKPIIAAAQEFSGPDFTTGLDLARFNTDGSLDTSFGTQGKVSMAIDRFLMGDAALQSDGKLLVAGTVADANYPTSSTDVLRFIVLRFNTDGSLDTSFGTNGLVRTAFTSIDPTFSAEAKHIAVSPTGTIAVGGSTMRYVADGDHVGIGVAEYNSSGQLLTSFSTDGLVADIVTAPDHEEIYSLGFQPDGKLLVSYEALDPSASSDSAVLARYNLDGILDSSFGTGGKVQAVNGNPRLVVASQILVAPDNKILLAGGTSVQRLNANGSRDTSFGGGDSIADPPGGAGVSYGMLRLSDGRLRMAGPNFVQYNVDGTPDPTFSASTIKWPDNMLVTPGQEGAFDPDGKLIVPGRSGVIENGVGTIDNFVARVGRDDVALDSDGMLWADGTAGNDTITITQLGNSARLVRNGVTTDFTKPVTSIQLDLLGGNDTGTITLSVPARVEGGAGNDSITTATGNDTITDSAGDDTIVTGAGNDSVTDTNGHDSIVTGEGDDHVIVCIVTRDPDPEIPPVVASITAATISTGDGNDIVVAGGTIHATLGAGNDQYSSPSSTSTAQYVDAADGNDSLTISSNGADTILAGAGDDRIISYGTVGKLIDAGDGEDLVVASTGSTILGGAGNDLLVSSGSVSIHGGDGDDRISVYTAAGQSATIYGEDGMDSIMTGDGNDSIVGGANKDIIHAGNGNDTVRGYGGNDKIFGAGGDDLLCGCKGDDRIDGGDGNDTLWGNGGTNRLSGNAGDDMIWARNSLSDTLDGGEGLNRGIFDELLDTVTSVVSV